MNAAIMAGWVVMRDIKKDAATNKTNGLVQPARPFFYGRSQNIRTEILQSNVLSLFIRGCLSP